MTEQKRPKNIVLSTKTTQEITVDKEALARWAQEYVERSLVAYGITKQEIEKGFCRYEINYEQLGILSELIFQAFIDQGHLKEIPDVSITGSGKDTAINITMDMAKPSSMGIKVINGLPEVKDLTPKEALQQVKDSISMSMKGATIDAALLVGGIQSVAKYFDQLSNHVSHQFSSLPPEEKEEAIGQFVDHLNGVFEKFGIQIEPDSGSKVKMKLQLDKMLAIAEKKSGPDLGIVVKRGGNGTASILVDYRRIVDVATNKAQTLLANKAKKNIAITPVDDDTFNLVLHKDGDGSFFNGLIEAVTNHLMSFTDKTNLTRQAYGTLHDPKNPGPSLPKF